MEDIGNPYKMYSVDILNMYYRKPEKSCGYLANEIKQNLKHGSHEFMLGKVIAHRLPEIGENVDFVILDSAHVLPGEILDFLVIFPFLTDTAIVCLHDIALTHYENVPDTAFCNASLLSAVCGEKFINIKKQPEDGILYPNIGAFKVNDETLSNIGNVFIALSPKWQYLPTKKEMEKYAEVIHKHYEKSLCSLFDEIVKTNVRTVILSKLKGKPSFEHGSRILIYGAGACGRNALSLYEYADNLNIVGVVDKNYENIGEIDGIKVQSPEEISVDSFDYILIAIMDRKIVDEVIEFWRQKGVARERMFVMN